MREIDWRYDKIVKIRVPFFDAGKSRSGHVDGRPPPLLSLPFLRRRPPTSLSEHVSEPVIAGIRFSNRFIGFVPFLKGHLQLPPVNTCMHRRIPVTGIKRRKLLSFCGVHLHLHLHLPPPPPACRPFSGLTLD